MFSDSDLITSLTVNNVNSFDVIDNVEFGVTSVPEPATLILFGAGLATLTARRRLTKRS